MKPLVGALVGILLMPAFVLAAPVRCECVRALRVLMGIEISGNAWKIIPNKPLAEVLEGDVILFDYGGYMKDHAALNIGFDPKRRGMWVWECNYKECECGTRFVSFSDPTIKGLYRP